MHDIETIVDQIADKAAQRALDLAQVPTRYLRSTDAARYLGLSNETLEKWRTHGEGPVFTRLGRAIRYDRKALDDFMLKNRVDDLEPAEGHTSG